LVFTFFTLSFTDEEPCAADTDSHSENMKPFTVLDGFADAEEGPFAADAEEEEEPFSTDTQF